MMGNGALWGPIAARLGGRVDLRAPDFPGHGRSPDWQPQDGIDYHTTLTRLAAGAIDRPLDLIGHSLGATVALRIAVGAPHAVRSLTLIEPVLFAAAPDAGPSMPPAVADAVAGGDLDSAAALFLGMWGAPRAMDALPSAARARLAAQMRLVLDTDAALSRDSHAILREGGLESIDAPVMLISGAESPPVIAGIAEALAARLPDVGRASVPGAGHMAPVTHPDAVAGLIGVNLDRA